MERIQMDIQEFVGIIRDIDGYLEILMDIQRPHKGVVGKESQKVNKKVN